MKTTATLVLLALAGCGILNLGATNEDGTPKTAADARAIFRAVGDAALQTWGTQALQKAAPQIVPLFDGNGDGILTLAEMEAATNLEDPQSLTMVLVAAIHLLQAKGER